MTPHYISNSHPLYNTSIVGAEFIECYGNGKYCVSTNAEDYKVSNINKFEPDVILEENLIQKCIYLKYPNLYYDYMVTFYNNCISTNEFNKVCGKTSVLSLKSIDYQIIDDCVYDSFNFKGK